MKRLPVYGDGTREKSRVYGNLDLPLDEQLGKALPHFLDKRREVAGLAAGLARDHTYTGKALAGLAAAVGTRLPRGGAAAFLHSGGMPTLFAQGEVVAAALDVS